LTSPVSYLFGNALPLLRLPKFQPALYFFNIGSVRLYEEPFFHRWVLEKRSSALPWCGHCSGNPDLGY